MPDGLYRRAKKKSEHGLEKFLGELELAVMGVVWERQPVSVADVLAVLNNQGQRNLACTTIMTIMSRLHEKGWLTAEKQGRAYIYRAAYSRQNAEAEAVGEVVRALVEDFGEVAVAQFVKELDEVDPQQLARLARLAHETDNPDAEKH